jgi:glyoxylase I family protein
MTTPRIEGFGHIDLKVADRPTLEDWSRHLDQRGIPHSGIKEENGGPLITLRDRDNIQVEPWVFDPDMVVV